VTEATAIRLLLSAVVWMFGCIAAYLFALRDKPMQKLLDVAFISGAVVFILAGVMFSLSEPGSGFEPKEDHITITEGR
jgi:hypothetical protein